MSPSFSESAQSLYLYELTLSTSGPLEDAVLLIPIPCFYNSDSGNNETIINISQLSFSNINRDNISVTIETVNGVPMLNISADEITPLYKNRIEPIMIMPGENVSELPQPTHIYSDRYSEETPSPVRMEIHLFDSSPDHKIDTRMPFGKEPLVMPYRLLRNLSSTEDGFYEGYYLSRGSAGYLVEVPFILTYHSDEENVLTISSELQGINQWWILGWQSNSYHERISHEFAGEGNGTYLVTGLLATGDGVY